MTPSTRVTATLSIALIAALVVGGAWLLHVGPFRADDRGAIIATVNGTPIYLSDARARAAGLSAMHADATGPLPDKWQDQVLQSLVDDVLVQAEAARRGLAMSDQDVAKEILKLRGMFPDLTEYEKWLDSQQMNEQELERRIRLQGITVAVYGAVTSSVSATDGQVVDYYETHADEFLASDGTPSPLADVRDSIEEKLTEQQKGEAYATWLDEQRKAATVVVVMNDWWRRVQDE